MLPPRVVEACDEARPDRIFAGEHDWDGRGRRFGGQCRSVASGCDDDRHLAPDEVLRQPRQPVILTLGRAILDRDVLPLDIAGFLEALAERRHQVGRSFNRRASQKTDHRQRRLLRPRRERPRDSRAAEQCDELAPPHAAYSKTGEAD